jgi:hypothetical protein
MIMFSIAAARKQIRAVPHGAEMQVDRGWRRSRASAHRDQTHRRLPEDRAKDTHPRKEPAGFAGGS